MDNVGTRAFAVLPDLLGDLVEPHPDGRAWRKACPECAYRVNDPQGLGAGPKPVEGHHFYCIHRQDEGCDRICACYAAIISTRLRTTPGASS
jgi:hypothetical protein